MHITVGLYDSDLSDDAQVSYIADDRDTAFNEANTMVTIAGEKISLGELLGSGSAMKAAAASDGMPGEFVKSAVDVLMDLLTEAELYAKYQAVATDDAGRSAFDGRLNNIAERAQGAVDMIFGTNASDGDVVKKVNIITDGTLPIEDTDNDLTNGFTLSATDYIRATQTVRGLNRLLDALSSADAFVDATKNGNNGVFENALERGRRHEGVLGEQERVHGVSRHHREHAVRRDRAEGAEKRRVHSHRNGYGHGGGGGGLRHAVPVRRLPH